jgi:DNA-binding MarR family transcriptional regulator
LSGSSPVKRARDTHELDEVLFTLGQSLRRLRVAVGEDAEYTYAIGAGFWQLVLLGERGSTRISEIATALNLDISTVSRQLKLLEQRGLVEREADAEDGRVINVGLTKEGRAVLDRLVHARLALMDEALADWEQEDVSHLTSLLARFAVDLQAVLEDPERASLVVSSVATQGQGRT